MTGSEPSRDEIRCELERILCSPPFRSAESVSRLLRFTVEKTLQGEVDDLKEFVIGLEVFGRGERFDPTQDTIVRVQAAKLRKKLTAYYETQGAADPVRIGLPKGHYVPAFSLQQPWETRTIAVLPFLNLSSAHDTPFFCDGLTEELICLLTKVPGLRVVAQTSSFQFKGTTLDIREIGRQLNAQLILEGSVRLAGEHLRVTAQLVSVADGCQLWSEGYDSSLADVFEIQDEIANAIARTVQSKVEAGALSLPEREPVYDLEAFNNYLRGRYCWNLRTESGFRAALKHFEKALEREPRLARAYAGMADTYVLMMMHNLEAPRSVMPKAREAALAALGINPNLAAARSSLAAVYALFDWDLEAAKTEWDRAIRIDPGYATARHWRGLLCDIPAGRCEEAVDGLRGAESLDPLSLPIANDVAFTLYWSRRYGEAEEQCRRTLELNPAFYRVYILLARIYAARSVFEKAVEHSRKALSVMEGDAFRAQALSTLGHAYARMRRDKELEGVLGEIKLLAERSFVSGFDLAIVHAGRDDHDEAFAWLERAVEQRTGWIVMLPVEPLLDPLRASPQFTQLHQSVLDRHR